MSHEVELKFDLAPEDVEALRRCLVMARHIPECAAYESIYFDTSDRRLRREGFSLRIRRSNGRFVQTLKRKRGSTAGLSVRREWESRVAGFEPDRKALDRTPLKRLLADGAELRAWMRSHVARTRWQVSQRNSRVEIVLDRGSVKSGRSQAPVCEIELELLDGRPRALFELAEAIGKSVPLRLGVLTKSERGQALAQGELGQPAGARAVGLTPPLTEAEAFRAVAHSCLRHYRLNEIVLLERRDPVALHQARIALRRLRSAFSFFRETVRGKDYQRLRDELGWLAAQFGDARNLDVMLAQERDADEWLRARLIKAHGRSYDRVDAVLASDRSRALMMALALWIEAGPWRFRERGSRNVEGLAVHQLERRWRKVRRHAGHLGKTKDEELHALRLDVKKLRYASEFLAGLWPKKAPAAQCGRFIVALKELQDALGDLSDAATAEAVTKRFAPGLSGSADRIKRRAFAADKVAEASAALMQANASAGYWRSESPDGT